MARPSSPTITRLGRELRKKRGPASTPVAGSACGVPGSTLTKIERGAHLPSYDTALALARWLGWSVEEVMTAAREPVPTEPATPEGA